VGEPVSERPAERGKDADWRDPWPVTGVRQGDPEPSAGVDALALLTPE